MSTGLPTEWIWDFGDGNTSTLPDPTHTYSTPGTFTVAFASANDESERPYLHQQLDITIEGGSPTPSMQAPSADFSVDSFTGIAPFTINFTDQSVFPA
jgi:PKD repeat protein